MTRKIGVLITGGDFQALGALRSLARKDVPICLLDNDFCISKYSRYRNIFLRSPSPFDEDAYVAFLVDLAVNKKFGGWIILPNSDKAVYVLSKNKELLEKYFKIPTPP